MFSKKSTAALVVFVLMSITGTTFGIITEVVTPIPNDGGDGPIVDIPEPIIIGTYLDQRIDFKQFSMHGHVSNWSSENSSFEGSVSLEDGFYNSSFRFADMRQQYYGNPDNERTVYLVAEASFYTFDGYSNLVIPQIDFRTNANIFFPGIDITSGSSIRSTGWSNDQFLYIYSPGYDYDVNLWVNDGTINTMTLDPYWNMDADRLYTRFFIGINLTGDIDMVSAFTDQLDGLPTDMAPQFAVTPEPATMALLGLGGIILRRKRNK